MKKKTMLVAVAIGAVAPLWITGCSSRRPVVYPNEKAQQAGEAGVAADIDECMRLAEQYTSGGGRGGEVAKDAAGRAAVGAGVGAAAGAAGGAIYGDAGRGAASGAAGGAAAGLLSGIFGGMRGSDPDPVYANFVNKCLADKGYQVIGWE
jgi:hypothetical protein